MVVYAFNLSIWEQKQEDLSAFQDRLVYIVSSNPTSETLSQSKTKQQRGL